MLKRWEGEFAKLLHQQQQTCDKTVKNLKPDDSNRETR
jgi:hypothetical protein